jgi:hypothetical protein
MPHNEPKVALRVDLPPAVADALAEEAFRRKVSKRSLIVEALRVALNVPENPEQGRAA